MLLEDRKKFKFDKEYFKVLYAAPAFDNSLCFMGMREFRMDCLTHVSSEGKILKELTFEHNTDSFAMLTDRQAMVLLTRNSEILVWNLDTYEQIRLPHMFKAEEADQSFLHVFPQTNLVCVQENGRYNNNTFKLTYYKYPIQKGAQPYHVWDSTEEGHEDAWTYEYIIRRANTHSMFLWFKPRHDDGFEFRTYDLRADPKGKFEVYKFANKVGEPYGMNKTEVAALTMWEMRPLEFIFVCISNRTQPKECVNNNYVYDCKTGVMREAKFKFDNFQDLTIDQHSFGSTCMFRTFDFQDGKPLPTPIYYIDNEKEEIVHQESTWECSYLYKYGFTGTDANAIVELKYENGNVTELEAALIKIVNPKEVSAHFLCELIDDCDDNLIYQVIQMLDNK